MYRVTLGREYWSLNDIAYRWLQQNAIEAPWNQAFGQTDIEFDDEATALRFKKYMKRKLNENPPTK